MSTRKQLRVTKKLWFICSTYSKPGWYIRALGDGYWGAWLNSECYAKCTDRWMAEAIVRAGQRSGAK